MHSPKRQQRGATLIVGLIMLTVITVMVTSAFSLSTTNLQSVGNMQFRDEAIAAANKAIEQVLSSPFTTAPVAQTINVDLDHDDAPDYEVVIDAPICISDAEMALSASAPSSVTLPVAYNYAGSTAYQTVWDITAHVSASSGATVNVHQGVRVLLSQIQYTASCV